MWLLDTNTLISSARELNQLKFFKKGIISTTIFSLIEYPVPKILPNLEVHYSNHRDYIQCIKYSVMLQRNGTPIPAVDIMIGTMAIERKLFLVTEDKHFNLFWDVERRLKRVKYGKFLDDIKKITE